MTPEEIVIAILGFLLLATNIFWAKLTLSLTNRLMSRNYFEFTQGKKNEASEKKPRESDPFKLEIDPHDQQVADQLNSLMGIV